MQPETKKASVVKRDTPDFAVVGIGFSAGGWPALLQIIEGIKPDSGMAFVVTLHLSPDFESTADDVVRRVSQIPVKQVNEVTLIEPNNIYILPPSKLIRMFDGHLDVQDFDRPIGKQVAIDTFFRSLAEAHKQRAFAVVLSGTGTDGAAGIKSVKDHGGITIVQHPSEAAFSDMPQAAISTGAVDFILGAGEIPAKLVSLWQNAKTIELPPIRSEDPLPVTSELHSFDQQLQDILLLLRSRSGHDFRQYKRATVVRRIERRMQVRCVSTLAAYRGILESDNDEHTALLKDMLIGVTNFFRDAEAYAALDHEVLSEIFRNKRGEDQVRVWVPACSTGEEAYTLAMLFENHLSANTNPPLLQVFASDIDTRAIHFARTASYPASIITDVPQEFLGQYFTRDEDRYVIRKAVRDKVLFAEHNLLRDPPFSKIDMISCRNLLIYLNRDAQAHLFDIFHFALNPGGFLFLGSSESAEVAAHLFTPIDKKQRIYRVKALSRTTHFTPALAAGPRTRVPEAIEAKPLKKRSVSFAEIHQRVLAQYAPPSIVINYDYEIVFISDRAGQYLQLKAGEPSRNALNLILTELRLELRTALFQAMQTRQSVEARRVKIVRDNKSYFVNMTVRPFNDEAAGGDFLLVMFDEVEQTMSEPGTDQGNNAEDQVLAQLEEELQRTKLQLQETIEHSEVSTEDLRASNEELQAINEELRSATEELETSKEELQSLNEELVTVNYELKNKIEETSKANDDLNNLIASTDIATIFVDRGRCIKRYTPRAAKIFNIIPTDIGRSLFDITHKLGYPELGDDVQATLSSLRPSEREVSSNDGHYYIVRHLPYRTVEDHIEGVVITFFDITNRREMEERLKAGAKGDSGEEHKAYEDWSFQIERRLAEALDKISADARQLEGLPEMKSSTAASKAIADIHQAIGDVHAQIINKLLRNKK
ncbi:MAG TPA: CheR family methyltransferase [Methylophilaceae bacterium]|nr:CheR family methyltransferase [Methylophilaceae bacterium]